MLGTSKSTSTYYYNFKVYDIVNENMIERNPNQANTISARIHFDRFGQLYYERFAIATQKVINKYDATHVNFLQGNQGSYDGLPQKMDELYNKLLDIDAGIFNTLYAAAQTVNTEKDEDGDYVWSGFDAIIVIKLNRWYMVTTHQTSYVKKGILHSQFNLPLNDCNFNYLLQLVTSHVDLIPE